MPAAAVLRKVSGSVLSAARVGRSQAPPRHHAAAIALAGIGAFLGVYLVGALGPWMGLGQLDGIFLIGSFGATAVLVYGAPHAEFSQPRNVVGGHVISGLVGVFVCGQADSLGLDVTLASAWAVSLAIVVMHWTKTLHPPGGATALIAVIGGPAISALGYRYVLTPVLVGALLMLVVGLVVNNLGSEQSRYPRYWH